MPSFPVSPPACGEGYQLVCSFYRKLVLLLAAGFLTGSPTKALAQGQSPKPRFEYRLSWDGESPQVHVALVYSTAAPDSLVFTFGNPDFGGQADIFTAITRIAVTAPAQVRIRPSQRRITVYHRRAGRYTLSYTVAGAPPPPPAPFTRDDYRKASLAEMFRPVVLPHYLYLDARCLLLNVVQQPASTISLQWDAFPARMPYFCSAAPTALPRQKQVLSPAQAQDFVLVAGSELRTEQHAVQGTPYYALRSTRDTLNHPAQALAPFFTQYFPAIQAYWNEPPGPYYALSVLPLHLPPAILKQGRTMGGNGLTNGFALFYSGLLDHRFVETVAHETSHAWLGGKLRLGEGSFANQWFGEGFNDYVCIVNLARAGMFDADFLPYVNEQVLQPHYTSKVRSAPNDSIAAHFWTSADYQRLPYRRGFLYAFYLDNQIQLASSGRASLRDGLLRLLARSQQLRTTNPEAALSLSDFVAAVAPLLPPGQAEQSLKRYIIQGEPLDFATVPLVKGLHMKTGESVPVLELENSTLPRQLYKF